MEENYTPEQLNFEFLKAQFLGEHTPIGCMEFSSKALISTSPGSIFVNPTPAWWVGGGGRGSAEDCSPLQRAWLVLPFAADPEGWGADC